MELIPYILLEGTLEDWEKILKKLEFLSKYGFDIYKEKKTLKKLLILKKGLLIMIFGEILLWKLKQLLKSMHIVWLKM